MQIRDKLYRALDRPGGTACKLLCRLTYSFLDLSQAFIRLIPEPVSNNGISGTAARLISEAPDASITGSQLD
ncbi:hypothetical protein AC579_6354 [Pseudocercospora musae]|uniref:Uncharacterized protein n=1 Tax=Pseudocercospora musae TaxID=113226 RepID=A0A139I7F8_9PEZI|nr:hypothetical protein AC579_6354 [Pseudocercospora musae]